MPGFLSEYDEITTVYFDPAHKWWAKVKRFLRRGDYKAAQAILVSPIMRMSGADSETKGEIDTGGYQNELVARAIVDWNLTDENDTPIPLGAVDRLKGPDAVRYAAVNILPQPQFEVILQSIEGQGVVKKPLAPGEEAPKDPFPEENTGGFVPDLGNAGGSPA